MILSMIISFSFLFISQVQTPAEDYVLRVVEVDGKWRIDIASGIDECVVINALRKNFDCVDTKRTEP